MPLRYELESGLLRLITEGDVDYESGLETLKRAIEAAAARSPGSRWHLLFDIRSSTENRSADELRGIAVFLAAHPEVLSGRCAIVASDPLHFGLSRMFEAYSSDEGIDVMVVETVDQAERWLRG